MTDIKKWKEHSGLIFDAVSGFEVIECDRCGFKHIVPIPSPEELESIYRHDYYTKDKPLYLERHREDLEWWNLVYAERFETFERFLPQPRRRILDVGSGPGFFLLNGKERGWTTLGIEPSAQAAAHARSLGVEIIENFLDEDLARKIGTFDAIHMSEVIEHIPDPVALLRIVHGLLAPGGILCVVAPNDYSPFQDALRRTCGFAPWWVAPPHHINYFDFDSLERLFIRTRFEKIHQEATFPIDLFLLMGDDYVGNDALGRQCHNKRMTLEKNLKVAGLMELKSRWYQAMGDLGLGREAVLYGRVQF